MFYHDQLAKFVDYFAEVIESTLRDNPEHMVVFDEMTDTAQWTPEMDVPFHEGDFNIEYVVIRSPGGKQLYRDDDK